MAKVNKTKTGKAQGAKTVSANSTSNSIEAERGGHRRTFSRLIWDNLPPAKEGWKEVSEAPKEPKAASKKPKADDTIKKVLTQDDLDLNPELAEQGLKVGDEIEIPKEDGEN